MYGFTSASRLPVKSANRILSTSSIWSLSQPKSLKYETNMLCKQLLSSSVVSLSWNTLIFSWYHSLIRPSGVEVLLGLAEQMPWNTRHMSRRLNVQWDLEGVGSRSTLTLSYTDSTDQIILGSMTLMDSSNFLQKCSTKVTKITLMVYLSSSVQAITLKCLISLGVMKVRPPPGGPIAASIISLSIFMNCRSFLLYHPLWSRYCLSNSIGGCAPYYSFLGMLRSSTKTMHFLPMGGPQTPFLSLSILPSMVSWVWLQPVCALNTMEMYWNSSPKILVSSWLMFSDLPVPVGPTFITFLSLVISSLSRYKLRALSPVGIISSWYCSLKSMVKFLFVCCQVMYSLCSWSYKQLQMSPFSGQLILMCFLMRSRTREFIFSLPSQSVVQHRDQVTAKMKRWSRFSSRAAIYSGLIFLSSVSVYGTKKQSSTLMSDWQMLLSMVVTIYFKKSLSYLRIGYFNIQISWLSLFTIFAWLRILSGSFCIQLWNRTSVPRAWGSIQTMPHRLTVAGEATAKSYTSNIIVM